MNKLDSENIIELEIINSEIFSQYGYKLTVKQLSRLISLGIEMGYFRGMESILDIGKGRWKTAQNL